jgi:hypothetical protein
MAETKPDPDEVENFSTLIAELREIETDCDVGADLQDIHSSLVNMLSGNRYRLGEILHRYRVAVVLHGAWLRACEVLGRHLGKTERTIRAIVADYQRRASVPAELIEELERADIDAAAKRNTKVVEKAQQLNADGQNAADSVKAARRHATAAKIARFEAVWKVNRKFTQDERWTVWSFESQVKGVAKVPPDRKADIAASGLAVLLWHCGQRDPITITPRETIDLAKGKKPEVVAVEDEGQATG